MQLSEKGGLFMTALEIVYVLNITLLLLHEIESAYVKEWEILHLPGKITGFLLLHVPVLLLFLWGAVELGKENTAGKVIALIAGIGGLLPFLIHKVLVKRKGYFESSASNAIIYLNILTGVITIILFAYLMIK
jgi:hypothetical protein